MSNSPFARIPATIVAAFASIAIAVATPIAGATSTLADDGTPSQTTPNGHGWIG